MYLWISKCHMEDGELLREKGHFRESTTEQQMPFVSSRFCKVTSIMDSFIRIDLQAYLEKRRKVKKNQSHLFCHPLSLVNAQDWLRDFCLSPLLVVGDANKSTAPSFTNQLEHY